MKEGFRQAMAWLHTWAGLVFGWLLFAIFLTGTLSYFKDEVNHWTHPEIASHPLDDAAALDKAQRYLEQHAAGMKTWYINLPDERQPYIQVMYPGPSGRFANQILDAGSGQLAAARESMGGEFFYQFHYQLQLPYPWGRWLASLCALVMLVTLISGIITHKKIFKEFFTFRPRKGQRSWLDGHNAVGVLVLPFHLMITYSSLVIFMTMLLPGNILAQYGKQTSAIYDDLMPSRGVPAAANQPAPLVSLSELYRDFQQQAPGSRLGLIEVDHPGDANASVVFGRHGGDRIVHQIGYGRVYDGVSGALRFDRQVSSVPMMIAGGLYGMHMGHFAGPGLRWLYFLAGISGTAMIGTGLVMWLGKRQLKHAKSARQPFHLRLVAVLNVMSMGGLMLAVIGFFYANRLLPFELAGRSGLEVRVFFWVWALSALHAALRPARQAWLEQLGLAALLYAGLPLLNAVTTGQGLNRSLAQGDWAMAGVDLTALAWGLLLAWAVRKLWRNVPVVKARKVAMSAEGEPT
ncbi:PepSY-associated TM helix domain-containing protein [Pseudomonas sp. RIT-To-2]|uniref:PepSY-associated TM helix domain-containing protein n=1 Tax=Pseudomonas sp. RIT-To-2 TaxID=3462541 RepID=UPI002413A018